jgi:hypothetical protein
LYRAGVYIGWVGFLNLGDEVMYELCCERFPSIHWALYETVAYSLQPRQFIRRSRRDIHHIFRLVSDELTHKRRLRSVVTNAIHTLARLTEQEVGMCGGGTFINRNADALNAYNSVRKRTGHPVPTFGNGVAHPEFWSSKEAGWVDRRKEWVAAMAELPLAGVRGPISKALLEDAGARNVVVCGDPAVAFHASYAGKTPSERVCGSLRVGINAGDCVERLWGHAEGVQSALAALAVWLAKSGHQVEIIPVWPKDVEACVDVARRAALDQSVVSPVCWSREAFMSRVQQLDVMVCLKLHAGILAAAANVPFVSLEYQPKCRDFAVSIGWDDLVIRTDDLQPQILIDRVSNLIEQLDGQRKYLCKQMCVLMDNFEQYCRNIEPLLFQLANGQRPA